MDYEGDRNMKRRELQHGPAPVEKIKGKLAVLAIGAAGLGFGGLATANANGSGEQAINGAEVSTASTGNEVEASLGPNALRRLCKAEILTLPKVTERKMHYPGKRIPPRMQTVNISADYAQVAQACNGKYRRISDVKTQLQNFKRRKKWINLDKAIKWRNVYSYDPSSNTGGNKEGSGGANISSNGHEGKNVYYRCTPGKRKTHARFFLRNRVKDLETGKIIGKRVKKYPIKIQGGGC